MQMGPSKPSTPQLIAVNWHIFLYTLSMISWKNSYCFCEICEPNLINVLHLVLVFHPIKDAHREHCIALNLGFLGQFHISEHVIALNLGFLG